MKKWMLAGMVLLVLTVRGAGSDRELGNVIFIHPDGTGVAHWQAARFLLVGPDGDLFWDRLPHVAIYRGHPSDCLTASSNAGATMHAYGIKVGFNSFGTGEDGKRPKALSGFDGSIMHEAVAKGLRTGLINSGSVVEPGTSAFVASVASRRDGSADVTRQVVESGVDVILSGGEEWFLPEGVAGRHTASGKRQDGLNLIERAKELGYQVVFTGEELAALPAATERVLGIFSEAHMFNDQPEEVLKEQGAPTFKEGTPTLREMTSEALRFLSGRDTRFFLVVEEEGTDNFGNQMNATGTLDALARADETYGLALEFLEKHPDTLIITAADSSAGGMDVLSFPPERMAKLENVEKDPSGAHWDRAMDGNWFLAAPDRAGKRHPFLITWASSSDVSGGIVARAAGMNAKLVQGSFDNTRIYEVMHQTLFGKP